jgi:prolyl-tRNA synthetase
MAAAAEQHGEDGAIRWPAAIAPYDVHVVSLHAAGEEILARAEQVAISLDALGLDVLLDDREARPGEKFADADLIGAPIRITVGKKTLDDGAVDVRAGGEDERVPLAEVAARVGALR